MWPGRVRYACGFACCAATLSLLCCACKVRAQQGPSVVAEPPPLVWPAWLVHLDGVQLKITQGADGSKNNYLLATYYTHAPMTQVHTFYESLLKTNDYRIVTAGLETGHTMSGTSQNAWGHVEGDNYPNGEPGPYTNVRVDFGRSVLNGPIRVNIKLTAHPQLSYGHEITHKHNLPPLSVPKGSANAREAAVERERKNLEGMEKYDKPVAPRPRPSVTWPAWLGHIEGPALRPQNRGNSMMTASYTTNMDSESIRAFYADLLSYHGYSVDPLSTNSSRLRTSGPTSHMGSVKGVWHPNGSPGARFEILVQYRPVDLRGADLPIRVELRVTGFPAD